MIHSKKQKRADNLVLIMSFVLLVFLIVSALSAFALDYKIIEEKHSIVNHHIVLEAKNTGDTFESFNQDLTVLSAIKRFNIINPKIERVVYVRRDTPIYEDVLNCEQINVNESLIKSCTVTDQKQIGTDSILVPKYIPISMIPTKNKLVSKSALSVDSNSKVWLKFSWQTQIYDIPQAYGSAGSWSLNPAGWWNTSFGLCRNITINNPSSTNLSNFTIYLNVSLYTGLKEDFSDIRFVTGVCGGDGSELYYEIENYTSDQAHVWVKTPLLIPGTNSISLYYNNSDAVDSQDAHNTWDIIYEYVHHMDGGDNQSDSTSNEFNFTNDGADVYTDCAIGNCFNFSRVNDNQGDSMGSITNNPISGSSTRCYFFTFLRDWVGENQHIVGTGLGSAGRMWQNGFHAGNLYFDAYADDHDMGINNTVGRWVYVHVCYDGSVVYPYENGTLRRTDAKSLNTFSAKQYIGRAGISATTYFDGMIDEVRLLNVNITQEYANMVYQNLAHHNDIITFGIEQQPPPEADIVMFFLNSTDDNTTFFYEGEDFESYINHTSSGVPISDSNCTITYPDGIVEERYTDADFTLCDSGCGESNILDWTVIQHDIINSTKDEIRFSICHYNNQINDLIISWNCTTGSSNETILHTSIPSCTDAPQPFIIDATECKDSLEVTVLLDNNAVDLDHSHRITSLEHDRIYSTHIDQLTYNTIYPIFNDDHNDLILMYHLDNNSVYGENDTFVYDFSQTGDHGTPGGNAYPVPGGYFNGGYMFDGDGDYILVEDSNTTEFSGLDFTITSWVYINNVNPGNNKLIVGKQSSPTTKNFQFGLETDNTMMFSTYSTCSASSSDLNSPQAVTNGTWYHVAIMLEDTVIKRLFINGTEVSNSSVNPSIPSGCISDTVIGANLRNPSTTSFDGTIDEVRIWNRTLTYSEIGRLASNSTSQGLYSSEHEHEYYEHGTYNLTGTCTNPDPFLDASIIVEITIQNVPPIISHTIINISDYDSEIIFLDDALLNLTNQSVITFYTIITDDDFANATYTLIGDDNVVVINKTDSTQIDSHIAYGINFTAQNYTFTTTAYDSESATTIKSTNLVVDKYIKPPEMTFVRIHPTPAQADNNLRCSAIALDQAYTNLTIYYDWYRDDVHQPEYDSNIVTTNNTLTFAPIDVNATGVVGEDWTCRVRSFNNYEYSTYLNTTITLLQPTAPTGIYSINLSTVPGGLLLFVLIFLWLALLALGIFTGQFVFMVAGYFVGIIIGFIFLQVHALITVIFVLLNVTGFILLFIDK